MGSRRAAVAVVLALAAGACGGARRVETEPVASARAVDEADEGWLTDEQILAGVTAGMDPVQACWGDAVADRSDAPEARLLLTILIEPDGTVSEVSLDGDDPVGIVPCVTARVREWHFERAAGPTRTSFNLNLHPHPTPP